MTAEEAAQGGGVAHDDWDAHWEQYAAAAEDNPAQRYRHRLVLRLLAEEPAPVRLLDLGSGQGDLLAMAAARWPSAELAGIELSEVGIAEARRKVPGARLLSVDVTRPEEIPADLCGWATHVVCSEVLEHVDDDAGLLAAARALMAPGCRVVVTVPGGRMSAFDRHIGHRRHYDPALLAATLRRAGLRVERTLRAGFPVFNLYRSIVIARGDRLVDDVAAEAGGAPPSRAARVVMGAMRPMFRANLDSFPLGIQMVGVATVPAV